MCSKNHKKYDKIIKNMPATTIAIVTPTVITTATYSTNKQKTTTEEKVLQ